MTTIQLIPLLLGALVTARVTRLVTTDRITQAPRNWLLLRLDEDGLLSYLIKCDWCASVYVGGATAAVGAWAGAWSWMWAGWIALSYSYVAGWLASKEGE